MKKSIFLQLGSLSVPNVEKYAKFVADHPDVYNLVVTYIGGTDGNLFMDKLIALKKYLPGFDNVFFGTATDYVNAPDPYGSTMLDAGFRWKNLTLQKKLAQALSSFYSDVTFHWYIEHEAALNKLGDGQLRAAYEAYLVQSVRDLRNIRPNTAIMWSPAIWEYTPTQAVESQLNLMFNNVKTYTDGVGVNWLHLQDTSGRHWFDPTPQNIKDWFDALPDFDSKRINVEQFKELPDGSIQPADRAEVEQREYAYTQLGMPVGACWEARWYYGVQQQTVAVSLGSLYTPSTRYDRASNISWTNRQEVKKWLTTGVTTGDYSNRAAVVANASARLKDRFPLEVQGAYYMRPYVASVVPGRAVNSDHLTAGALDIFFRNDEDKKYHGAVKAILDAWERRNITRYYLDLGYNWAHRDHIHVSFQIGVRL